MTRANAERSVSIPVSIDADIDYRNCRPADARSSSPVVGAPWIAGDTTKSLAGIDGQQRYLDQLNGILETAFIAPFSARLQSWRLGNLSVLCLVASTRRSIRTAARIAHDRYDAIGVQYVAAGRAIGDAAGRRIDSTPGTVMILDYRRPFTITDLDEREVVNIAVPRTLFPDDLRDIAERHGAVLSKGPARLLGAFMAALATGLPDLASASGARLEEAFLALLAASLDEAPETALDPQARLIRRAENLVDDRIGSPELGPAWLAAQLGVSRSELYATLDRFGGVARFILQRRLNGARAVLRNPRDRRRIREIAFAFGFSSEAHFARAFRTAFGVTASQTRREEEGQGAA